MVAPDRRATALTFVMLLVASAVVVVSTPTATAASATITLSVPAGTATPWPTGTTVTVTIALSAIEACTGVPTAARTATVTIDIDGKLNSADFTKVVSFGDSATSVTDNTGTFVLQPNQPNGVQGPTNFGVTIDYAGCAAGGPADVTTGLTTNTVTVDTKAPTIAPTAVAISYDPDADHIGGLTTPFHGIGATVRLAVNAADGTGGSGIDPDDYVINHNSITGLPAVSGAASTDIEILDSAPSLMDGVQMSVSFRAEDEAGNFATGSINVPIDNVRPGAGATLAIDRADLTRHPSGATVKLSFTPSGGFAAISATSNGETAEAVRGDDVVSSLLTFGSGWDYINDPITVTAAPVDAGGNVPVGGLGAGTEIDFPDDITLQFGGAPETPTAVRGNEFRNIYVNVTTNEIGTAPLYPAQAINVNDPDSLKVYGELVRIRPQGNIYWRNGTTGNDLSIGTVGDFRDVSNAQVGDRTPDADDGTATPPDPAGAPTTFLPGSNAPGCATGTACYLFTNLSASRTISDGSYELWINMRGAETAFPVRTLLKHPFFVDGNATKIATARNHTKGVPSATSSAVHGGDGNPIRVSFNTTDWTLSDNAVNGRNYHDSGLRNVTVELVSTDLSTLALNTSRSASLPLVDRAARVNITRASCTPNWDSAADRNSRALPYCHDLTDWTDSAPIATWCSEIFGGGIDGAPTHLWNQTCFVYDDVVVSTHHRGYTQPTRWVNQTWTFINATQFSGWVNVSMDDLPAGEYRVRILSFDHAGRNNTEVYGSDDNTYYKVAPVVRLQTSSASPRVTDDGRLVVDVYGMQHFAPPAPSHVATSCVAGRTSVKDVCPPDRIRILVSNSDAATNNNGVPYVSIQQFASTPTSLPDFPAVSGQHANGSFLFGSRDLLMFKNAPFNGPVITSVPGGNNINLNAPIYVRAVAENDDGSVQNVTSWIRAASDSLPSFVIDQPNGTWAMYPEGSEPAFFASFDRKADLPAPKLSWWITDADSPPNFALAVGKAENITPNLVNGQTAKFKFNWSDVLELNNGNPLPAGEYRINLIAYDSTSTPSAIAPLGDTFTNFAIVDRDAQGIVVDTVALLQSDGVYKRPLETIYYTSNVFEVPFTVTHGEANLTDTDWMKFRLVRSIARPGQPTSMTPGTDGFAIDLRAETPLAPDQSTTTFVARVTLPDGAVDGDSFRLNITAETDRARPHLVGNITTFLDFVHDKLPASAALNVTQSEDTVFDRATETNKASPAPAFWGNATDMGSGVEKIEVRVFDITTNETLVFGSGTSPKREDGLTNDWLTATNTAGAALKLEAESNGIRLWKLTPSASALPLDHVYRVDLRVTDNLGQRSEIVTTTFDFDPVPPLLGYGGRLGTTTAERSGIFLAAGEDATVAWHDEKTLTVRVSDNHCIAEVRLKGYHESNPSAIVSERMSPDRERCAPYPATVGGRTYQTYTLDLADAPNMTDKIGNYTYWFEAWDDSGQHAEIPLAFRLFKMRVLDESPAVILNDNITFDPPVGQAGSRALVRAEVFDNYKVDHVTIEAFRNGALVASGEMRPSEGVDANGTGIWIADTTDDLDLDLSNGNYTFVITPYDVNWNRTEGGEPTCEDEVCEAFDAVLPVRDDGPPATVMEAPTSSVVNATPEFRFRAQHKLLQQSGVTVVLDVNGTQTTVPTADLQFTELKNATNAFIGWTVVYRAANLTDGVNLTLNVTLNVGGLVNATSHAFRVDALPPTVTHNVTGTQERGGKIWALSTTSITLSAEDSVSAVTRRYTVNGGAEQTYTGPITPAGDDGLWTLEYWATDAAGNAAAKQTVQLNLDRSGPRIAISKHGDDMLLTVTDTGVGLNESTVTVHYRYGEAISFSTKPATKVAGNSFGALLPGNATATGLAYYVTAADELGNTGTNFTAIAPYVILKGGGIGGGNNTTNGEPTISITYPTPGAQLRGAFDLKWLAEDPESAPLTITIALSSPVSKVLAPAADNSGTYRLNLSGPDYPAGAYTLVVTATDGEKSASRSVTFSLESGETVKACSSVPPPLVQPNQQVNVGVCITPAGKTVLQAQYRVIRNGELFTSGKLSSTAGAYGATFTPSEPGDYRVLVDVAYSDGSNDASKQVATFSVPGDGGSGATKVFPGSLIALVAIAALTVALAAYGAFGRWKK